MKRHLGLAASVLVAGVALIWATPGRAQEYPMVRHCDGRPQWLEKGDAHGFYIWHSDRGWHVLCASTERHHFKGRVWVEGEGAHFKRVEQWKDDSERKSEWRHEDWFWKSVKRIPEEHTREIKFDVVTQGQNFSGITFEVAGGGKLLWDLMVGGYRDEDPCVRDARRVHVGGEGRRPDGVPFETPGFGADAPPPPPPPAPPPVVVVEELHHVTGVTGRMEDLGKGEFVGYDLWHRRDSRPAQWNLLVTTRERRHHFKGKLWLSGRGEAMGDTWFEDIAQWKSEDERESEGRHDDWFAKGIRRRPEEHPTEISFDLVSQAGHSSGIRFAVHGPGTIEWDLAVGGPRDEDPLEIDPKFVRVGPEGKHPHHNPFYTWANPDRHGN